MPKTFDETDILRLAGMPTNGDDQDWSSMKFFNHGNNRDCSSIEDALKSYSLNWDVKLVEIHSHSDNPLINGIDFRDHRGLIRCDNNFPLSTVGAAIYTPIQNHQCLQLIEDVVQSGQLVIEAGGSFDNGRRNWVACRIPEPFILKGLKSDSSHTIIKYIHINWSHDQTQAVTISFMPYLKERNISLGSFATNSIPTSMSFRHTTFVKDRMIRGAEIMRQAMRFFKNMEDVFVKLINNSLDDKRFDEMLNLIFPEPDPKFNNDGSVRVSNQSKSRSAALDRWNKMPSDLQNTDFGAVVAVSEHIDFEGRSNVRSTKYSNLNEKRLLQAEKRLDSSLFGNSQNKKQEAMKAIFNFDIIKAHGGLTT